MKVAIIGSRDFPRLEWVRAYVARKLSPGDIVVSGAARGVDEVAARAARDNGYEVIELPANWAEGKAAGKARNWAVVMQADRVVAFWDKQSPGTAHAVTAAVSLGKPVEVYSC